MEGTQSAEGGNYIPTHMKIFHYYNHQYGLTIVCWLHISLALQNPHNAVTLALSFCSWRNSQEVEVLCSRPHRQQIVKLNSNSVCMALNLHFFSIQQKPLHKMKSPMLIKLLQSQFLLQMRRLISEKCITRSVQPNELQLLCVYLSSSMFGFLGIYSVHAYYFQGMAMFQRILFFF